MFGKIALALAIVLVPATGALAASKQATNPGWGVYVGGKLVGADPDARIRSTLQYDHGND
jgi:hypothetical protein